MGDSDKIRLDSEREMDGKMPSPPALARRKLNKKSTILSGRTIGAKRERLETRNERMAARKKDKKRAVRRVVLTIVGFLAISGILIYLCFYIFKPKDPEAVGAGNDDIAKMGEQEEELRPTIEVVDEDATKDSKISGRMSEYIALVERDFQDLGYKPVKAVVPTGAIREVDFYLDGISGFIKTTIDRDAAMTVEDADRMIRYLNEQGVSEFSYIDVRIERRAYYK